MLEAKTEEQKSFIKSALKDNGDGRVTCFDYGVNFCVDFVFDVDIDFDTMAKIVDYLREQNNK